jgi:FixJ family two-component response regulator
VNRREGPLIYLVDDDDAVRDSLGMLFDSIGLAHEAYPSALDFLQHYDAKRPACLVADIRMPGLSGLELQQRLNDQRAEIPIIFITGHGDVPMAVTAMKSGAADFIQKPFRDQDLIDRINKALERDRERRKSRNPRLQAKPLGFTGSALRSRHGKLSHERALSI